MNAADCPKAELHCHIEGAASPLLVRSLANRYGIATEGLFDEAGGYVWNDFGGFLTTYGRVSSVFRSKDDFRALAFNHFSALAAAGTLYAEIFVAPDLAQDNGVSFSDYIDGLDQGIAEAEAGTGIVGRMVITSIRHLGPGTVRAMAEWLLDNPHPRVTGFGIAGDETRHHPRDFKQAFRMVSDAGYGLTAHAGELAGPESVWAALDEFGVRRIGHGVRSIEDPALVRRLAADQIVLELCPSSNVALGLYPDLASHPYRRLMDAGVPVTINSDDPPFFHTSLAREYEVVADAQNLSPDELRTATGTAIQAAFVDNETKAKLARRLEN